MNDRNHVRKRIQKRKFREENQKQSHPFFNFFYRLTISIMILSVGCLTYAINDKVGIKNITKDLANLNFNKISSWLPFETWFSLKDETVTAKPSYSLLKENLYTNGTNTVYSLMDGVILYVQKDKDNHYLVSIAHDNGIVASYGNLLSCESKINERILKDDIIGSYKDNITLTLIKDKAEVNLEEALAAKV
ncbi:MAG: M23 family metallopeptidase [Erysipelotrichaceae bacterium]